MTSSCLDELVDDGFFEGVRKLTIFCLLAMRFRIQRRGVGMRSNFKALIKNCNYLEWKEKAYGYLSSLVSSGRCLEKWLSGWVYDSEYLYMCRSQQMGHIAQPLIILGAAYCELLEYTLMDYVNFFFLRARDCVVPF